MPRSGRKRGAPIREEPRQWRHYALWSRVRGALRALPGHFSSPTVIEGMQAGDIFTLNAALGATIEEQVVHTLNEMRAVWDPDNRYQDYAFIRQSQTFPDVLLRRRLNGQDVLLGIELKGWYMLAKEGEPNFRFKASRDACNPWDLIACVPWALSNVLAGSPVVYPPFIELARYAAERRTFYWQVEREAKTTSEIRFATGARPYPTKPARIADEAKSDSGRNFGRLARYGIMETFIQEVKATRVAGVAVSDWLEFLRKHARDPDA